MNFFLEKKNLLLSNCRGSFSLSHILDFPTHSTSSLVQWQELLSKVWQIPIQFLPLHEFTASLENIILPRILALGCFCRESSCGITHFFLSCTCILLVLITSCACSQNTHSAEALHVHFSKIIATFLIKLWPEFEIKLLSSEMSSQDRNGSCFLLKENIRFRQNSKFEKQH